MSTMWIRVKKDGFILPYSDYLAKNPSCEVVPEEVAFPERFVTPVVQEAIDRHAEPDGVQKMDVVAAPEKRAKGRAGKKATLDLMTDDIPEPPQYTPPELAADAARGLP